MDSLLHMIRPTEDDFLAQLEWVNNYAALRVERSDEIKAQKSDIVSFLARVGFFELDRMPKTMQLLKLVIDVTIIIHMRIKHALACRRPLEYSPQVQPMIVTPGHGSLPSGHATEAFVLAFVMDACCGGQGKPARTSEQGLARTFDCRDDPLTTQFMRIAERIATNRTVAGYISRSTASPAWWSRRRCRSSTLHALLAAGEARGPSMAAGSRGFPVHESPEQATRKADQRQRPIMQRRRALKEIDALPLLSHAWKQAVSECGRDRKGQMRPTFGRRGNAQRPDPYLEWEMRTRPALMESRPEGASTLQRSSGARCISG